MIFAFAAIADLTATLFVLRDTYQLQPVFDRHGLDYEVEYRGHVGVGTRATANAKPAIDLTSTVVAIDGRVVAPEAKLDELARRLEAATGPVVTVDLKRPDGSLTRLQQRRAEPIVDPAARQARDFRVAARLIAALIACASLLVCSLVLALRRPNDPVAMLFALAFAGMAATIDPPLQMWMGLGWATVSDIMSSIWFYLLMIALAVFPDGFFVPRIYRWLLLLGVPLAIFLSLPEVDGVLQGLFGAVVLLAMLVGQFSRFRRLENGIERQQIKWAAFGFAIGLVLILGAFILLLFVPENQSEQNPFVNLAVLLSFSLGMAAIPLGLLIALTRFRLWEADTVITRSAAYAVVTVIVGVVWAASSDLVKLVITEVIGRESEAGATTVGAIIAAGIFSPTQSAVLGWTRRHFGGPVDRIHGAVQRLKSWGLTETPEEVATRALSIIDDAIHPSASAIVLDTPHDRQLIAARGTDSPDDRRLIERLTLADEESAVGELLLGRRSDGNRYNRQELEAVRELIPALAEALRVARGRHSRETMMQRQLEEMAARLAQLEGGAPKPA